MAKTKIRVEFALDANHSPIAISSKGKTHYKIRLFVEDVPEDAHAVTYQLHETYYDPTREVRRDKEKFQEDITSYGDYTIRADIRRKKYCDYASTTLSKALRETYRNNPSQAILKAIEQLEQN